MALRVAGAAFALASTGVAASALETSEFVATQFIILLVGLVTSLSDAGLSLETTRLTAQHDTKAVRGLLGSRTLLAVALTTVLTASLPLLAGEYAVLVWLCAIPYVASDVLRNHVYSQVRAAGNASFELASAPLNSLSASAALAVGALVSGSGAISILAWSAASIVSAIATTVCGRRLHQYVSVAVDVPRFPARVFARGRATFILGLLPKVAGIALGAAFAKSTAPESQAAWALVTFRALDTLYSVIVLLLVVPAYARGVRGNEERLSPQYVGLTGLIYLTASLVAPLLILRRAPEFGSMVLSILAAGVLLAWTISNWHAHYAHARSREGRGALLSMSSVVAGILLMWLTKSPPWVALSVILVGAVAATSTGSPARGDADWAVGD